MILDDIVNKTKERLIHEQEKISLVDMECLALRKDISLEYPFYKALKKDGMSYIMEVKKASPSKGLIAESFDYLNIALEYQKIGASAISVLTEPYFFKGNCYYLNEISNAVKIPVLRKDFIIDKYMIYQAKLYGASAYLLICAILDDDQLKEYIKIGKDLGMDALVEAHDSNEISRAIKAGARIIGVNNRDLRDFTVDLNNSIKLRKLVNEDIVFVSESGIRNYDDIKVLEDAKVDAVLIGETMMRASDKQYQFDLLRGKYES